MRESVRQTRPAARCAQLSVRPTEHRTARRTPSCVPALPLCPKCWRPAPPKGARERRSPSARGCADGEEKSSITGRPESTRRSDGGTAGNSPYAEPSTRRTYTSPPTEAHAPVRGGACTSAGADAWGFSRGSPRPSGRSDRPQSRTRRQVQQGTVTTGARECEAGTEVFGERAGRTRRRTRSHRTGGARAAAEAADRAREGWRGHPESGTNDRVAPIGNHSGTHPVQDPDSRRGEPHVRPTPQEARRHRT